MQFKVYFPGTGKNIMKTKSKQGKVNKDVKEVFLTFFKNKKTTYVTLNVTV